jgi:hypothetical protein
MNDRPILLSDKMLHKDYSVEKITGRDSQGARRQDELIGGKPTNNSDSDTGVFYAVCAEIL